MDNKEKAARWQRAAVQVVPDTGTDGSRVHFTQFFAARKIDRLQCVCWKAAGGFQWSKT